MPKHTIKTACLVLSPVIFILSFIPTNWKTEPSDFSPYTQEIPGTDVNIDLSPIPSGTFLMGSPQGEASRNADEGPQHKVDISAFWMGTYEITWQQYEL